MRGVEEDEESEMKKEESTVVGEARPNEMKRKEEKERKPT